RVEVACDACDPYLKPMQVGSGAGHEDAEVVVPDVIAGTGVPCLEEQALSTVRDHDEAAGVASDSASVVWPLTPRGGDRAVAADGVAGRLFFAGRRGRAEGPGGGQTARLYFGR